MRRDMGGEGGQQTATPNPKGWVPNIAYVPRFLGPATYVHAV